MDVQACVGPTGVVMMHRRLLSAFIALALTVAGSVAAVAGSADSASVTASAVPHIGVRAMSFPDTQHGWIVGQGGFISATCDGGQTWFRQYASTSADLRDVVFVDRLNGWIAGEAPGVILRTVDGGIHWEVVRNVAEESFTRVAFADRSNGWLIGVDDDAAVVWHTSDGGLTWGRQNPLTPSIGLRDTYTALACSDASNVWVAYGEGGEDAAEPLHVFRSMDGGATWQEVADGSELPADQRYFSRIDDIAAIDSDSAWLCGQYFGTVHTADGGATWTVQRENYRYDLRTRRIEMLDVHRGIAGGPVVITDDGGSSWESRDPEGPLTATHSIEGVARPSASTLYALARHGRSYTGEEMPEYFVSTSDTGQTWGFREVDRGNITFLGGKTRYDTAIEISQAAFSSADTVLLTTGRMYPDALAASGLAGHYDAPILLTDLTLPYGVISEIERLGASKVVIVGGPGAVPEAIETQLRAEFDVDRIGGGDRYETARLVAQHLHELGADTSEVFVTRGDEFADALSAAAYAAGQEMPVLLVRSDAVTDHTHAALEHIDAEDAIVIGGTGAVSGSVAADVSSVVSGRVIRPANGSDRYVTSSMLAEYATDRGWAGWQHPGLATGALFPDGLAGGAALGQTGQVGMLVRPDSLPPTIADAIRSHQSTVEGVWIFGDRTGAVQDSVANAVGRIVAR